MEYIGLWQTLAAHGESPTLSALIAALLATYGICKLLEFGKYGPLKVLYLYEWVFSKVSNDYCLICMSFWVMITTLYLIPEFVVYGISGIGAYIAIEMMGDDE